ncbi:MAG: Dabb family protein [Pseudomonadota bacterium]
MIRHCVFIRYKPETPAELKRQIGNEIAALKGRLVGLEAVYVGDNVSPEGLDKGHGEGFIVDFTDDAARDRYLEDAEHKKTGAKIVAAAEGGIEGIFVYDLRL